MESTNSTFIEVEQQHVSMERDVLHGQALNTDQRMAEHGQHANVNIDHGSATSDPTTHLHVEPASTPTHLHCQHDNLGKDIDLDQHTNSSSKLITNAETAVDVHFHGQTASSTQLPELHDHSLQTPTTHPGQTADSQKIASISLSEDFSENPSPSRQTFQNQDSGGKCKEDVAILSSVQEESLAEEEVPQCITITVDNNSKDENINQIEEQDVITNSSTSNGFMSVYVETDDRVDTLNDITPADVDLGEDRDVVNENFEIDSLDYELQVGYKILISLMGAGNRCVNKLFIHPVDDNFPETSEYYSKIKKPMWMLKMKEKFESLQYTDLTQFMADFRLMIENCYRFNGPDNFVSKKAQKLEMMLKQKIALLSKELREKLMGSVNTDDDILMTGIRRRVRNPNFVSEDPSQQLLSQLRRDKVLQEREDRRQRSEDKKAMEQARIQEIQDWEDGFIGKEIKEDLRTMWEIPQIGLFIYLCMETLGLDEEITQYQLERGLVAPRESFDFKRLMTCLLSTTHQRKSLKTFMPYHVWNAKLNQKLSYFYKVLSDCNGNHQQACYKLGFDNRAFKVMGKNNPMLKKSFHELPFRKRVWVLKSYCDFCMETQSELQKTVDEVESERPSDVREVLLGSDGRGNRYINFPMFTGKDIRIYRHSKLAEPSLRSLGLEDWSMVDEKPSNSSSRCSTPVNPRSQRLYENASSSLRARAILQAAESKEASPLRDISKSGVDLQDENSNSNMDADSVSSELTDSCGKKTSSGPKKRKRSGYGGGKRKRLKGGHRKQAVLEDNVESPNPEKEEVEGTGDRETSVSPVPGKAEKEVASDDVNEISENKNVCDKNTVNDVCDVRKNLLSSLPTEFHPGISEDASDSEINAASSNPTQLFKNYATNVEEKSTNSVSDSVSEKEKSENVTSSLANNDVKNHDSAYLSCDSDKSFKTEDEMEVDKTGPKAESGLHLKKEEDIDKEIVPKEENISGKLDNKESVNNHEKECDGKSSRDTDKKDTKNSDGIASMSKEIKAELKDTCEKNRITEEAKAPQGDSSKEAMEIDVKKEVKEEEQKAEAVALTETPDVSEQEKASADVKEDGVADVKEEVVEEEESDDEELPDLGHIELVAESMEEIRQLIHKLSNPEPIKRGKRVYPGLIKPCEEELLANLSRFHDELTKYERSLFNARVHAQVKLRKEVENYVEPRLDDGKCWESESSQTSKESSDDESTTEAKKEAGSKEKPKKAKSKVNPGATLTSELLSSAANKLSTISADVNEDSNDSYELDISSRGRLRKRRIIPNNTEDTGIKKRKNLLNQDLPSASVSCSTSPSPNAVPSPSSLTSVNSVHSSIGQQQHSKSWPQVFSVVSSPSNSAIKAQLTSPSKSGLPCQIVRLVSPSGDTSYKTVQLTGKRNMVLSPEAMANIRFISSTGVITVPKNSILTSSSSAHSSHPVIQQLLLNQARQPVSASLQTVKTTAGVMNTPQVGIMQPWTSGSGGKALSSGHVKVTLVSSSTQSSTLSSTVKSPSNSAVVVTQVSTSIISHGGKQILDLGSLSVTQIQQLVKNQAIQINTGAGNPTTLLLTKGLQQLATSKISTQPASTTLASVPLSSSLQIKMPVQRNLGSKPDAKSLLSMSTGNNKPQVVTIPGTLSGQTGTMTVLSGRQVGPQLPVIRTIINRPIQNTSIVRAVNPPVIGATIPVSHVMAGTARLPPMSQGPFTVVPGSVFPKQPPAPRIITSLASPLSNLSSTCQGSANKENPPMSSNTSSSTDKYIIGSDPKKTSFVNIPFSPHSSPQKKYASNVTVKALLENRTIKKSDNDVGVIQGKISNVAGPLPKAVVSSNTQENSSLTSVSSCFSINLTDSISVTSSSLPSEKSNGAFSSNANSPVKPINDNTGNGDISLESAVAKAENQKCAVSSTDEGSSIKLTCPSNMQPLSVDTAIQPLMSSAVQVTLPTVNIKVPSPNTLPSLTHNKNSTIIVQSTKVPIPVASAENMKKEDYPNLQGDPHLIKPLISSSARMVASTVDSVQTAISNTSATQISTQASVVNPKVLTSNTPSSSVNLKNVMLKLTPPKGASGPFVQGFMTSKGKLVIPQNALLQQQPQQVIQASPNRVILANASYNSQLQTSQLQNRPAQVASNLINQNVIKNLSFSQNAVLQPIQQPNGHVVIASQPQATVSGVSAQAIPIQNGNPGIKVMLINQSNMAQLQQGQAGVGDSQSTATSNTLARQPLHTSTPASELVKQIANSTQLLATAQQQNAPSKSTLSTIQQNNVNVMNLNAAAQSSANLSLQTLTGPVAVKSGHSQANVNPQLAAQIIALQQGGKNLQVKPVQQQQAGIVLATKPVSVQQQQSQSSVMAVQLQQLGSQLIPGVGGIAQVQVPTSQLQHATAQIATAQTPIGTKAVQPGQVVQLALNPQAANPSSAVLGQPQAQIVQVAGQLSPHLQLAANQNVSHMPQQGSIILQQPGLLQSQQQAVVPQQNTGILPIQMNSIGQQKAAQPLKPPLVGGMALNQQPQLQSSQAQIQLVINQSAASSTPLPIGTVLKKPTSISTVNVPQLASTPQIIRAIVNPAAGMASVISNPRLLSPTKLAVSLSSPQTVLGTTTQLSQVVAPNVANANQLLISPVKLAPPVPPMNRTTPVKFINPSPTSLRPSSTNNAITNQLVQKIHFKNTGQGLNTSQGGSLSQNPLLSPSLLNTSNASVGTEKIAHRLLSQPGAKIVGLKQIIAPGDPTASCINNEFSSQPALKSTTTLVKSKEQISMASLSVQPSDNTKLNATTLTSLQSQQLVKSTLTDFSRSSGSKYQSPDGNTINGNKNGSEQFSHPPSNFVVLGKTDGQMVRNDNVGQGNSEEMLQQSSQSGPDVSFTIPGKSGPVRRNTFSGSQESLKTTPQRHTSVDESSSPMMSKEMDEKEAALNLLTLANQPL